MGFWKLIDAVMRWFEKDRVEQPKANSYAPADKTVVINFPANDQELLDAYEKQQNKIEALEEFKQGLEKKNELLEGLIHQLEKQNQELQEALNPLT